MRLARIGLSILTICIWSQFCFAADDAQSTLSAQASVSSTPIAFTENKGQWPDSILFRADAGGATVWITRTGVYYQLTRRIEKVGDKAPDDPMLLPGRFDREPDSFEMMLVKAAFVGSNPEPEVVAEGLMEYRCNYFIGNDPDKWATDVPNYESIVLQEVYPGVNVHFEGGGSLGYRYEAAPGADLGGARVMYEGTEGTSIDEAGRVVADTKLGKIAGLLAAPLDDEANLTGVISYGGRGMAESDASGRSPLAVALVYSTYLGGVNGTEYGWGIAVDEAGNAFVTGYTSSTNFPTQNQYQTDQGVTDVFVTKLSTTGNSLVYSTYLGGNDLDFGYGIAVDGAGNAYVTGTTRSTNFPTENPYQTNQAGSDVFVTKLSSAGNSLVYSTYLGGNDDDHSQAIAVDGAGNAFVTGYTSSTNFPTQNQYQTDQGVTDVFVTKLSTTGNSLVYSTYLGGNDLDFGCGIAVDGAGNAYVTGRTDSDNFPTQNPYQTYQGSSGYEDVFVTKLSAAGSSLMYSTYLGGDFVDYGWGIAVDGAGSAFVTGWTKSTNFPTENPFQTYQDLHDGFVTKLSASGSSLVYSTYLAGNHIDYGWGIAVDGAGSAYVTGKTMSTDFPTENPYQTYQGASGYEDVFVTKLSAAGSSLVYSTYLGGNDIDLGYGIAVDGAGNAYVTGTTESTNFPTENPYQTYQVDNVAFITKLGGAQQWQCGDINADHTINVADLTFLVNYLFKGGLKPPVEQAADVNGTSGINVSDLTYMVNYLFRGGPVPVACP